MFIYYDFPEQEDYEFEITPDRFRDYIESQYSKSDVIDLVMGFYWDKFDEDVKEEMMDWGFNPDKAHESDYEAYKLFCDYLYDFVEDFRDGLTLFYAGEAHQQCVEDNDFQKEFSNTEDWY